MDILTLLISINDLYGFIFVWTIYWRESKNYKNFKNNLMEKKIMIPYLVPMHASYTK